MRFIKAEVRKFAVALVGAAGTALSLGLIPGTAAKYVGVALAVLTALGVYAVPNGVTAPPDHSAA